MSVGGAKDWTEREHAIYEIGYQEGGRNSVEDFAVAFEETFSDLLPDDVNPRNPSDLARWVEREFAKREAVVPRP